jgi:hypothetical protein
VGKGRNMQFQYRLLFALVLGAVLISVSMIGWESSAAQARCTLTIVNSSTRDFHRLHLASSGTGNWGLDQLGRGILHHGEPRSLAISPGEYDLLFIDADGHQCVKRNLPAYNDTSFEITDAWLSKNCQG